MDAPFPDGMTEAIARFLAEDTEPVGRDSYPAVFAHPYMFPLQRRRELERMVRIARSYFPHTVMEIGADKGGGLYHWCKCLPTVTRVIACEIRGLPYAESFERAFPHIEFLWVPCSSYEPEVVKRVLTWAPTLDVLFIDGDKQAFVADFDCYSPATSSVVFLHDITDTYAGGPGDAVAELERRGIHVDRIVDTSEYLELTTMASAHDYWLAHWKGRSCGVGVVKKR